MGLRGVALYRFLILPASLPAYVAGLKQGWAFAWRSLMAAELFVLIIGQLSIGQQLNIDQQNLDFVGVSSVIIVILVIGIVVDTLFTKADLAIRRRRGLLNAEGFAPGVRPERGRGQCGPWWSRRRKISFPAGSRSDDPACMWSVHMPSARRTLSCRVPRPGQVRYTSGRWPIVSHGDQPGLRHRSGR